jgi:hypothetical protein
MAPKRGRGRGRWYVELFLSFSFCLILLRIGTCYCMHKFINVLFKFPIVCLDGSLVGQIYNNVALFFKLIINCIFYLII